MTDKDNLNADEMNLEEKKLNENTNDASENPQGENASVLEELQKKLEEKNKECSEYLDLARRTKAEFDNYRKRTQKEKETIYTEGIADAVKDMLPILDNLERALGFRNVETGDNSLYEGVGMVLKSFKDILIKMGVEEIEAEGIAFDPDFHNAVMHVEDPELGMNTVAEVLQKGYKFKDKIIRHSMVKVAN